MTTLPPEFIPTHRWKVVLTIYFVGFLICELLGLWGAYQSGGFDRPHTLTDLTVIGIYYLVTGLLWPIVLIVVVLQLLGLLPHPIQF
jgi:hypothetical protein